MKEKLLILLVTATILLPGQFAFAGDARTELQELVTKVKADVQSGKRTEADLADDLNQFDALLAEHKGEKTDAVAQIVYMKAMLYHEVLHDDDKATALMTQLKTDFKDTQFVAQLEKSEAIEAAEEKTYDSLVVGVKFPDFSEQDVAGQPLSVANYRGKVVLVDFWATWCGPCVGELPNVMETYEKHHAQGFEIIGVSLDQDKQKLESFVTDRGMTWPQFFDGQGWNNLLAVKYGIRSIPSDFLLDANGVIIGKDLRGEALEQAVANALAK